MFILIAIAVGFAAGTLATWVQVRYGLMSALILTAVATAVALFVAFGTPEDLPIATVGLLAFAASIIMRPLFERQAHKA